MIYKKILILFLVIFILCPSVSFQSGSQITFLPDLSVESITPAPSNPIVYENVTIKILIKNKGTSDSPIVHGRLYVDNTSQLIEIPALKAGGSTTLTMYWTPENPGNYTLSFVANCNQEINEMNWSNNVLTKNITVGEGEADLRADEIIIYPSIPTVGQNVSLKAKITNIGTKSSSSCTGTFYVNEVELTNVYIWSLSPGSYTILEPVKWLPEEPGRYTIKFWADSGNSIDEPDEDNNNVSIVIDIFSKDTTPPSLTVDYLPRYVTEIDNVTFFANASDESGIDYIYISIHTEPSLIYLSNISYDLESLTYTCGPFPRKDKVYYYAEAKDKAGNYYRTPTYNFTVESFYKENLTVTLLCSPENPTEFDEIYLTANAYYHYGINELSILNYKTNYTIIKEYNTTELTFGPLGPFTAGTELAYWAKAIDVDGNVRYSDVLNIKIGEVGLKNRKNTSAYENGMVFLISDNDWRGVLSMVPISIWKEDNETMLSLPKFNRHVGRDYLNYQYLIRFPVLIYHYENDTSMDLKPIVNFLNYRWNASKVVIIGDPPNYLLEKLLAPKPVGAGLNEYQIEIWKGTYSSSPLNVKVISSVYNLQDAIQVRWNLNLSVSGNNTLSNISFKGFSDQALSQLRNKYWNEINKVVVTEDEYGVALEAAVYASLLNAPLLFKGHYGLDEIRNKRVFLVGDFYDEEIAEIESHAHIEAHYTFEELQRILITIGARNIVLVNPLDHWIGVDGYDITLGFSKFYYKQSLLAPFLAVAKNAVIVEAPTLNYVEVDTILQEFINRFFSSTSIPHIIILASPSSIPMARPNWPSSPVLYGDKVYFEVFNYNDIDIKKVDIKTGESHIFLYPVHQFEPFVTSGIEGCRRTVGLGGFVVDSGKEYCKEVRDIGYAYGLNTAGKYVVYYKEGSDETSNDIFISQPKYSRGDIYANPKIVVNTTADEENPDIYLGDPSFIVWQQRNNCNDDWDIHYMIFGEQSDGKLWFGSNIGIEKEGNQILPSVYDKKIVYQDDRNGNWDIYLYDIEYLNETRITSDDNEQILPKIHGNILVWQDNRNGNWDIYMYDISTCSTTALATSSNPEIRPNINERWIVWYERTSDGLWHLWGYEIATGLKKEIDTTLVSHEDITLLFMQADNRFYSSKNNDGYMDYPSGRLHGLTTSDLSAYVASDILFDDMEKNRDILAIIRGWSENDKRDFLENFASAFWTDDIKNEFNNSLFYATYNEVQININTILSCFWRYYVTIFVDHGDQYCLGGLVDSPELNDAYFEKPTFIMDRACSTAGYYLAGDKQWLLSTHVLRAGAMSFLGAVDLSTGHEMFDELLNNAFLNDYTIGEAFKSGKNNDPCCYNDVYILFGDPTIRPRWWS